MIEVDPKKRFSIDNVIEFIKTEINFHSLNENPINY